MTPTSTDLKRKTGDGRQVAAAGPLSAEELRKMDAYWRASNYLAVGQIYLLDNPSCANRSSASTSSRGCSATGARRPA